MFAWPSTHSATCFMCGVLQEEEEEELAMVVPHCGLGPAVAGHSRLHGLRHILRHLVRRRNVQEVDLLHAHLLLHVRLCHPTHQGTVMIILFCRCLCRALPFS